MAIVDHDPDELFEALYRQSNFRGYAFDASDTDGPPRGVPRRDGRSLLDCTGATSSGPCSDNGANQFPIALADPPGALLPAVSFLGGFRTPALVPGDRSRWPASETHHRTCCQDLLRLIRKIAMHRRHLVPAVAQDFGLYLKQIGLDGDDPAQPP